MSEKKSIARMFFRLFRKSEAKKAEEMLQLFIKYIPEIRAAQNKAMEADAGNTTRFGSDGEILGRMYDYYQNAADGFNVRNNWLGDDLAQANPVGLDAPIAEDRRQAKKPIEVMAELEKIPTPFNSSDAALDEKISTLGDKKSMLNQRYAKAQIQGLIKRLQNRKKYAEHVEFFSQFPDTSDEKIDNLLAKYKLVIKTSDLFIPTFPKEAIDIMKEYTAVTKKICDETPVFYVIAEEKDFEKKYEKLDPILLVQSPFGFYWQILGAWDKEMILLTEL